MCVFNATCIPCTCACGILDVNMQKKRVPKGTSDYQAMWIQDDNKVRILPPSPPLIIIVCISVFALIWN